MNRFLSVAALALPLIFAGCKDKGPNTETHPVDLLALAESVPNDGPRTGNNYKVFYLALRQDQSPAAGFRVDAWVAGKSEPKTVRTNKAGLAIFDDLPFPDATHRLNTVLHTYTGAGESTREIAYPYLQTDAYRLKDTQYVPNTVTPEPQ